MEQQALSKPEKQAELISLIILLALVITTVVVYFIAPDKIATHINKEGIADTFDGKATLLLFPFLGLVISVSIALIIRYWKRYDEEDEDGVPKHTMHVRIARLAKVLAMTGLLASLLESIKTAYYVSSSIASICFVIELLLVSAVFAFVIRQALPLMKLNQ